MTKPRYRILIALTALTLFVVPIAAIAAGGFTDVDDASVFKADIDWLAASDVTKGCNPPANDKFCPQNTVTREQMAAFMHRLAANQVVDAKTAVDSDTLDGSHATDIAPIVVAQVDGDVPGTSVTTPTTVNSLSITVPSDGVLVITGGAYIKVAADGLFGIKAYIDSTEVGKFTAFDDYSTTADGRDMVDWLSYTTATAVTPGTYVISQKLGFFNLLTAAFIDGGFFYNSNTMTVTFIPGGTVTASTAGVGNGGMTGGG